MYYAIQKNVFKDPRYGEIFRVLDELDLPYETVTFKSGSTTLSYQTKRKDVFVYGSVKLAKVAASLDWHPGSFYGGNHQFAHYTQGYGQHVINHDSIITNFTGQINWATNPRLFIKPSQAAKVFTGRVFSQPEWEDFVYDTLNDRQNSRLTEATLIQVSAPFRLIKEARTWVVGQRVVASSYYRFHDGADFEEAVAEEGTDFAQEMAALYNVAEAYVMDIALTYDGWKIVEVNCINSAGFYRADVKAIVQALEAQYQNP